jgi:hypothetical protein
LLHSKWSIRITQGAFREHSGIIQGTFREHSGNVYGTFRVRSGSIQGTFKEYLGNIQGIFRERSGNIQGIFREHSRNIQGTFRMQGTYVVQFVGKVGGVLEGAGVQEGGEDDVFTRAVAGVFGSREPAWNI